MTSAVVVGSGPNGLAAACAVAEAGFDVTVLEAHDSIGGGTRTAELTLPGLLHDVCSAVHPTGVGSPAFTALNLEEHGLTWCWPEVDLAHPLEGGRAGVMVRDIDRTASQLDAVASGDGDRWRRVFGRSADHLHELYGDMLGPLLRVPRHPLLMAPFGIAALSPAKTLARGWKSDEARALFGGVAAHAMRPFTSVASSAVAMGLIAAGHADGWPVAQGGSRAITDALASKLDSLGGKIETGVEVTSLDQCRPADLMFFDVSPTAMARIAGDALPGRVASAYRTFKHGPGAFKLDLAVEGGIPWTNEACRRAGTVHVAGTFEEMAVSEAAVNSGAMPHRPYVLLAQPAVADPTRAVGDTVPIWAYAHVPNGFTGDATAAILQQIERFAPGFRDRIVGQAVMTPSDYERYNANNIGGDFAGGSNSLWQLIARPRLALDPYATGIPGVYLCSAATPPGGGVHGMCGWNAAKRALQNL